MIKQTRIRFNSKLGKHKELFLLPTISYCWGHGWRAIKVSFLNFDFVLKEEFYGK